MRTPSRALRGLGVALRAVIVATLLAPVFALADDTASAPAFKPGMSWTYRERDEISGRETGVVRLEIVAVAPERVTVGHIRPEQPAVNERWDTSGNWEQVGTQRSGWLERLGGAAKRVEFVPALPLYRFPLGVGKSWVETVRAVEPETGRKIEVKVFAKALAWEEVAVPAGKFRALKIRRAIAPEDAEATRSQTTVTLIDWYAPQIDGTVRRIADWEYHDRRLPVPDQLRRGPRVRLELTAFEPPR